MRAIGPLDVFFVQRKWSEFNLVPEMKISLMFEYGEFYYMRSTNSDLLFTIEKAIFVSLLNKSILVILEKTRNSLKTTNICVKPDSLLKENELDERKKYENIFLEERYRAELYELEQYELWLLEKLRLDQAALKREESRLAYSNILEERETILFGIGRYGIPEKPVESYIRNNSRRTFTVCFSCRSQVDGSCTTCTYCGWWVCESCGTCSSDCSRKSVELRWLKYQREKTKFDKTYNGNLEKALIRLKEVEDDLEVATLNLEL